MDLNDKIKKYNDAKTAYYNGTPIMSDEEFDILENEIGVGNVGFDIKGDKIKHPTRMLSLSKYQADKTTGAAPKTDAMNWMMKIKNSFNKSQLCFFEVTPKFDGNAANCIYINGTLKYVLSRGDGEYGRDITSKIISKIPNTITSVNLPEIFEVRGEIIMSKPVFEKKYSSMFANPRNLVAGILGRDDNAMTEDIEFIAYDAKGNNEYYSIDFIEGIGFNDGHSVYRETFDVVNDDFDELFDKMKKYRSVCEFPLDGFVLKAWYKYRSKFKENDHDPEWGKAIKFKPEGVSTTINSVSWSIGKTGEFTPVANLDPVDLDGSTVSKVSLYNAGYIEKNNICVGTRVRLVKSGDIIPQIVETFDSGLKYDSSILLANCPYCGRPLKYNCIHLLCEASTCDGRMKASFYERTKFLGVKGIGEVMAYAFFDAGIHNPMDLITTDVKILEKSGMVITKNVINVLDQTTSIIIENK